MLAHELVDIEETKLVTAESFSITGHVGRSKLLLTAKKVRRVTNQALEDNTSHFDQMS